MAVYGNLASMPVPELLQWLGGCGKSGLLRLERDGVATKLFFESGRVVACISDDPRHLLGQFLLFRGAITEVDLREAMVVQDSTGRSLPDILVQSGALSSAGLDAEVAAKAQETILSLFGWPDAMFWYREGMTAEDRAVRINLEVQWLLLEGVKRLDELTALRRTFVDDGMIPRRGDKLVSEGVFDDSASRTIYEAVDGRRTLAEIQLIAHGTEFQVYRRLSRLRELGLVQVDESSALPVEASAEPAPFETRPAPADGPSQVEERHEATRLEDPAPEPETGLEDLPKEKSGEVFELDLDEPLTEETVAAEAPEAKSETLKELVPEAGPAALPPLETLLSGEETVERIARETAAREVADAEPPSTGAPALGQPGRPQPDFDDVNAAVESHLQFARDRISRSEPEAALDRLELASEVDPGHPSIGAIRAQAEAAMLQRYLREGLRPECLPVVVASREQLDQAETSAEQDYLVGLADGSWDIRSILSVCPLRPLNVMKALSELLTRGFIELQEPSAASEVTVGEATGAG